MSPTMMVRDNPWIDALSSLFSFMRRVQLLQELGALALTPTLCLLSPPLNIVMKHCVRFPSQLTQDYWGFDKDPKHTGPIPICGGGTLTFRFHSKQGVYQVYRPGDCPSTMVKVAAAADEGPRSMDQDSAGGMELLPVTQGTHAATGMHVWTDPGTDGHKTYYFTTQAGNLCEQGGSLSLWIQAGRNF